MKIDISGYIVSDEDQEFYEYFGISATSPKKVIDQLKAAELTGEKVEVYIDSPGGYVTDGSKIYTAIREHPSAVTVKVVGIAASSASLIAMAGNPTLISPPAQIMIHNASALAAGDYREHEKASDTLKKVNRSLATAYRLKTGLEESEILSLMDDETYFTAEEAVEKGFADAMMEAAAPAAPVRFAASASLLGMIPDAVLKSLKDKKAHQGGKTTPEAPEKPEFKQKEAENSMDKEKLKAEHAELYNQIISEAKNEGAEQERERINKLNTLASAPFAGEIVAEAIKNGDTFEATAVKIVQKSAAQVSDAGSKRDEDNKASGTANVVTAPVNHKDEDSEEAELKAYQERMKKAADAVNKQGGRI